ncbi:MAG TPA: hypothetical protein VLQ88_02210 [Chromatiaceae bacterium]|nr:hypothetical protein [Chromatiaceae bacterium]
MTTHTKAKSRVFAAVHETAGDLHRLGFIDQRKMQQFDVLSLAPIPAYDSQQIREVRAHLRISQAVLATPKGMVAKPTAGG